MDPGDMAMNEKVSTLTSLPSWTGLFRPTENLTLSVDGTDLGRQAPLLCCVAPVRRVRPGQSGASGRLEEAEEPSEK